LFFDPHKTTYYSNLRGSLKKVSHLRPIYLRVDQL
jgi:hypothetical protein